MAENERPDHGNQPQDSWHFDKTINISVMVAFLMAIASGIWYAATSSARLDVLEKQMSVYAPLSERIIRVETKMDGLSGTLSEIKQMLRPRERPGQ